MTDVRRADPVLRRKVLVVFSVGVLAGLLLIAGFERYDAALRSWLLSEPEAFVRRANLIFAALVVAFAAPLLALAAYSWSLGGKIIRAREFPPPGMRVIRDTPVVIGANAVFRGRVIRLVAVGCIAGAAISALILWKLALLLGGETKGPVQNMSLAPISREFDGSVGVDIHRRGDLAQPLALGADLRRVLGG